MNRLLIFIIILLLSACNLIDKKELEPDDRIIPKARFIKPASDTSVLCLDTIAFEVEAKDYKHAIGVKVFMSGVQIHYLINPPFSFSIVPDWIGERVIYTSIFDRQWNLKVAEDSIRINVEYNPKYWFTDLRDEKSYRFTKIGNQTWMAENLAFLPDLVEMLPGSFTEPFYYVYYFNGLPGLTLEAKKTQSYKTYGVIYNQPASKTSLCPDGWHVSSQLEWSNLIDFLGNNSAIKLKAKTAWDLRNQEAEITRSGFDALPGGYLNLASSPGGAMYMRSSGIGKEAHFWTSEGDLNWQINMDSTEAMEESLGYRRGLSIRCIKDK